MKRKLKPSMTWEEAQDTIGVEELMKILGVGKNQASDIFNAKGFPKIDGAGLKADKEAARLYLQGFKIKENQKNTLEYMILLELKKLNRQFEQQEGVEEDALLT